MSFFKRFLEFLLGRRRIETARHLRLDNLKASRQRLRVQVSNLRVASKMCGAPRRIQTFSRVTKKHLTNSYNKAKL